MANAPIGGSISDAEYQRRWSLFDSLPASVKAVFWDAAVDWDHKKIAVAYHAGKVSRTDVAEVVENWDRHAISKRGVWCKTKPGTRAADMPPTPHQAARVSILRAYSSLYRPPNYKKIVWR